MHAPSLAEVIHHPHDEKRLLMRHLKGFFQTIEKGFPTGDELIFITSDLLGYVDVFDELAVMGVDRDFLRIVDVVNYQSPLRGLHRYQQAHRS